MKEQIRSIICEDGWVEGDYNTPERITVMFNKFIEWLMENYSTIGTLSDDNYKVPMKGYYIRRDTYSNFGHNWKTLDKIFIEYKKQS
jgi:hypothetical protein